MIISHFSILGMVLTTALLSSYSYLIRVNSFISSKMLIMKHNARISCGGSRPKKSHQPKQHKTMELEVSHIFLGEIHGTHSGNPQMKKKAKKTAAAKVWQRRQRQQLKRENSKPVSPVRPSWRSQLIDP